MLGSEPSCAIFCPTGERNAEEKKRNFLKAFAINISEGNILNPQHMRYVEKQIMSHRSLLRKAKSQCMLSAFSLPFGAA
ncbi:hypothetical protein CEXT_543771 [Caerostris extrusa]|uniref:Uncharacterized protein n=1 Tax=Caerostris extrusa TaxID=172846 RepID=A0AAV4SPK7_CAEEX|nr:hypothetical protein CEXT_543771 [Caerostris extrusa]